MLIKIVPLKSRARNRVKEHGKLMQLIEFTNDKFLVQSLNKTWNGNTEVWLGWFNIDEATFQDALSGR